MQKDKERQPARKQNAVIVAAKERARKNDNHYN
jgi:hypothetical protein